MPATFKRALVLSGGGAKGVFEAGVLKACHHTGVTFDVLTGSSIGAINAVLFAEYQRRRQHDPERARRFFDFFLDIWEDLDAANLVDFDLLDPLISDLAKVEIGLDDLLELWWGLTGESRWDKIEGAWRAFRIFNELDDILPLSLWDAKEMYEAWQDEERRGEVQARLKEAFGQFLAKHNAERGLLDTAALKAAISTPYDDSGRPPLGSDQGLSSFRSAGIDVRLTRTNVRSGRMEISAHHTLQEVLQRLAGDPDSAGSVIVGDPNAIGAALTSGAFPVAFEPYNLEDVYPAGPADNNALHAILTGPDKAAAFNVSEEQQALLAAGYPLAGDLYIDGGAIDNHPLAAAIVAIKDAARRVRSQRQADQIYRQTHDVFVIFLGPKPEIVELAPGEAQDMLAYEHGLRAWHLLQNAKLVDDSRSAERITQLMERASGWKGSDRPRRILVNVNRIYPEEMLTGTLTFHRRMGFDRARNRKLLAMGCWTMLEVLAEPANYGRLDGDAQQSVRDLRDLDSGALHGWRCTNTACRVRDVCSRV